MTDDGLIYLLEIGLCIYVFGTKILYLFSPKKCRFNFHTASVRVQDKRTAKPVQPNQK